MKVGRERKRVLLLAWCEHRGTEMELKLERKAEARW